MENMHRFGLLLVAFVGIFTHVSYAALGDNCASEEGALCMANLHTLQMKDGGDVTKLSVAELVSRCAELRRNLACLLTHTQRCVALADKRDQHAKVILEARKYIAAVCEADESVKAHWKDSKCYRQASLQRCDREFQDLMHQQQQQHKAPSNPPTDAQCRTFHQYQACVQRTVASCSDDSENFVTLYLLDYGASLAWQCPGSPDDQGSGRHQANVIQTSGGGGSGSSGGSLGPLDPLGPQGPQESGGSQQGSGKNTGATRKTMADIRRIPVIRDTHFTPPHKIEAAFSGNTGSTCVKLIRNDMRRCYNRYQRQESELKKQQSRIKSLNVASDAQEVDTKPKVCCAFGAYTHCLQTAVQTRCSQDREALVDTIIAQTSKLIGGHCEEYFYGSPKCSSGASGLHARSTMSTTSVNALCVTLLLAVATSLAVRTATL